MGPRANLASVNAAAEDAPSRRRSTSRRGPRPTSSRRRTGSATPGPAVHTCQTPHRLPCHPTRDWQRKRRQATRTGSARQDPTSERGQQRHTATGSYLERVAEVTETIEHPATYERGRWTSKVTSSRSRTAPRSSRNAPKARPAPTPTAPPIDPGSPTARPRHPAELPTPPPVSPRRAPTAPAWSSARQPCDNPPVATSAQLARTTPVAVHQHPDCDDPRPPVGRSAPRAPTRGPALHRHRRLRRRRRPPRADHAGADRPGADRPGADHARPAPVDAGQPGTNVGGVTTRPGPTGPRGGPGGRCRAGASAPDDR